MKKMGIFLDRNSVFFFLNILKISVCFFGNIRKPVNLLVYGSQNDTRKVRPFQLSFLKISKIFIFQK